MTGFGEQTDLDINSRHHFYGINLLTLDKAPICPDDFFAPNPTDRGNLLQSRARYLCQQKFPGPIILIPQDQNPLNVIWITFTKPLYEGEKYFIDVYFNDPKDDQRIMQYLVEKYGEPHVTEPTIYWNFESEGIEVEISNNLGPRKITIRFPRTEEN